MKTTIYPELYSQESFRGYLIRFRQINDIHIKPAKTRRCITTEEAHLLTETEILKALAERLPVDIKPAGRRYEYDATSCFKSHVSRELVINKRRICPQCLGEEPYQRLSWEIVLFDTCTAHNTYLVEQCDRCCRQLYWTDSSVIHCRCGFDLRKSRNISAQKYVAISEQITQLQLSAVNPEWCPYPVELQPILRLGLDEAFRLVSFLRDSFIVDDYAVVLRDTSQVINPDQQLLTDALTNWPIGFSEVCKKLLEYQMQRSLSHGKNAVREFQKRLYQRYLIHFLIGHPALDIYRAAEKKIVKKLGDERIKGVA